MQWRVKYNQQRGREERERESEEWRVERVKRERERQSTETLLSVSIPSSLSMLTKREDAGQALQ